MVSCIYLLPSPHFQALFVLILEVCLLWAVVFLPPCPDSLCLLVRIFNMFTSNVISIYLSSTLSFYVFPVCPVLSSSFPPFFILIIYIYIYFYYFKLYVCVGVGVMCMWVKVPRRSKVSDHPGAGVTYRWLWAAMWLLGAKPRSPARATSVLNSGAISPAPYTIYILCSIFPLIYSCIHF